jgi:hypothetical protein
MKQRTELNHKERIILYKNALRIGKSYGEVRNEELRQYLLNKEGKAQVKLYKGYVFIHSKNSKKLYTMYELPDKYKEIYKKENK